MLHYMTITYEAFNPFTGRMEVRESSAILDFSGVKSFLHNDWFKSHKARYQLAVYHGYGQLVYTGEYKGFI